MDFFPGGIVVEGQFRHGGHILESEEGKVVQILVCVVSRHREHPTVRVTGVVHEPGGTAELVAIHNVLAVFFRDKKIQTEEIRVAIL